MPIVFVHGVTVRSDQAFKEVQPLLRKHVAERICPSAPNSVKIHYCYWGGDAAQFFWNKASRPRTLLRQGAGSAGLDPEHAAAVAETPIALREGAAAMPPLSQSSEVVAMGGIPQSGAPPASLLAPAEMDPEERADLVVGFLAAAAGSPFDGADPPAGERTSMLDGYVTLAALEVAEDPAITAVLQLEPADEQMRRLASETLARAQELRGIVAQGTTSLAERAKELFGRALSGPGYILSRAFGELRPLLSDFTADFLGDVLAYQTYRGSPSTPGPIPKRLLDTLAEALAGSPADEPLVVLTHSMGGQVAYDVFTAFAARDSRLESLRVDFWASVGSQVPFFEDAKLFLSSDRSIAEGEPPPRDRQPVPACVRAWWNVWDFNDFVSFTASEIFTTADRFAAGRNSGVVDEHYVTGAGLAFAHISYFKQPSFWRRFEEHLEAAGH